MADCLKTKVSGALPLIEAEVGADDAVAPDEGDEGGRRQEGSEGQGELEVLLPEGQQEETHQRPRKGSQEECEESLGPAQIGTDEKHHGHIANAQSLFLPQEPI